MRTIVALSILFLSFDLYADCTSTCISTTPCAPDYEAGRPAVGACVDTVHNCEIGCTGQEEVVEYAGIGGTYGAIAYSPSTGSYGTADHFPTDQEASKEALKACSTAANDCAELVVFTNACGAVAGDGSAVGWAWDPSENQAMQLAINKCTELGGKGCQAVISHCSQ